MEKYIHRTVEQDILPFLDRKEIIAITGPRQVGKTTYLQQLAAQLKAQQKRVAYHTFENRSDLELFNTVEDFKALQSNVDVIILDEFQYATEGGKKLKYLYDTTDVKFIISGSSSLELRFQTEKYLVGRMVEFAFLPLSFREFLSVKHPDLHAALRERIPSMDVYTSRDAFGDAVNQQLDTLFQEYILYGGYPAIVTAGTAEIKQRLLSALFEQYVLKDIRSLLQLATEHELLLLIQLLATQVGNLMNYQDIATHTHVNIKQLKKHIRILEETYIVRLLRPYFTNRRTELVKIPKSYFIDTGFVNAALSDFRLLNQREHAGALAENAVQSLLVNHAAVPHNGLRYWRSKNKAEIDFVIATESGVIPVEVKFSSRPTLGKSFYSFLQKYEPQRAVVLTRGFVAPEKMIGATRVLWMPMYYL